MNIIAVTSCPTGVAHTYLAEANLKKAAKKLNIPILVETQGAVESEYILSNEDIKNADIVLIAADKKIELFRFINKNIIEVSVTKAAKDAEGLLRAVIGGELTAHRLSDVGDSGDATLQARRVTRSVVSEIYVHLITGVNLMIPFVVAGGILIALSFAFGITAATPGDPSFNPLAKMLSDIGGGSAFALMLPVLAFGISQSISGKAGIVAGAVGGMMAIHTGSGFLGALLAGFLAGYVTLLINKYIKLPKSILSLKPILIVPLLSVFITGAMMVLLIGEPIKLLLGLLTTFLNSLGNTNSAILGLLFGMMVAFDMGGPLNKTVCMFAIGLMSSGIYGPIAACMAAGMVPPLGIALATTLSKRKFTRQEVETGKVTYILGLSFITEGAIPFAVADPFRVIPAIVCGSGLAGALSMMLGCASRAPHGGIFVMFIPNVITNVLSYSASIAAGSLLTALILILIKKDVPQSLQEG